MLTGSKASSLRGCTRGSGGHPGHLGYRPPRLSAAVATSGAVCPRVWLQVLEECRGTQESGGEVCQASVAEVLHLCGEVERPGLLWPCGMEAVEE